MDDACRLVIVLDPGEVTDFAAGDRLAGHMEIQTEQHVACREVALSLNWHSGIATNYEEGAKQRVQLAHELQLASGESRRFPFSLSVPEGPPSYRGKAFDIKWNLTAQANLAGAPDARTERQITVRPRGTTTDASLGPRFKRPSPGPRRFGTRRPRRVVVLGIALALWFGMPLVLPGGGAPGWGNYLFPLVGLALIAYGLRAVVAKPRLGHVTFRYQPLDVRRSQEVRYTLTIQPTRDVLLDRLTVTLRAEESTVRGIQESTGRRRTEEQVAEAYTTSSVLAEHLTLGPQQPFSASGTFAIPETAPCTFAGVRSQLRWWVRLDAAMPRWPDWSEEHPLVVRP